MVTAEQAVFTLRYFSLLSVWPCCWVQSHLGVRKNKKNHVSGVKYVKPSPQLTVTASLYGVSENFVQCVVDINLGSHLVQNLSDEVISKQGESGYVLANWHCSSASKQPI